MHCGLCLPTCPTYDATKIERHSPRGRISLMRAIADGRLDATKTFADEMYFCLGCLACMTACPAGVNYAELFEHARAEAESSGVLKSPRRNLIRAFAIRWLFMDLGHLRFVGRVLRLYQQLGLQTVVRRSGVLKLLPKRLQELEAITPDIQAKFSADLIAPLTPAIGQKKYRVAIITNAGGCGSHLKHYHKLLADDPAYRDRAALWDKKVKDIHEWLIEIGVQPPTTATPQVGTRSTASLTSSLQNGTRWNASLPAKGGDTRAPTDQMPANDAPVQVVTYHESCHLAHGQKITAQPRQLLGLIPNLRLVELPESLWCCGSAGIYNIIQPEMANQLLDRKLRHIQSTGATIVANGNPGCLLQLINGAKLKGLKLRVVHPVTLLAEAYRRSP